MPAPSSTVWGSIVGSYGRIGIYTALSNTETKTTLAVQVWFWSKYSVSDSSNTLYFNNLSASGSATSSVGSKTISTGVESGSGWDTANQKMIYEYSTSYTRGTASSTRYLYAKLTDVDRVGGTMYASTTVSIPKLSSYTVSYNANGGKAVPASQTKWYGMSLTLSGKTPTRDGYTFEGWATSASSNTIAYTAGASYTANASVTLYAVWKVKTYTVSYNANGGSGAPANQSKNHGSTLTLSSTKPTRALYDFKGWATSASSNTVAYSAGGSYTANAPITLYAVWELAYAKPRINNLSVSRCDSNGVLNDEGLYSLISFDWICDKAISSIVINWESASAEEESTSVSASGTSGSVNKIIGGDLSTESTYTITVIVTDESGYTHAFGTLNGSNFAIDFLAGGLGASFGKPAELEGVLDIAFKTRFFGGILPPVLEPETDLNDVKTLNTYVGANTSSYNYVNCPLTSGTFSLLVESGGEEGQVRQRLTKCSKTEATIFERWYYQDSWGDWIQVSRHEVVLYDNAAGHAGGVTFSKNLTEFKYLEIYFTDNNGYGKGYLKHDMQHSTFYKSFDLFLIEACSARSTIFRRTRYSVSANSIMPNTATCGYVQYDSETEMFSHANDSNYIKIFRIVGIR